MLKRLTLALCLTWPLTVHAQARGGEGYLFRRPSGSLTIRAGAARPNANGGLFDFVGGLLMPRGSTNTARGLSAGDYAGPVGSLEAAFILTTRAELVLGAAVTGRRVDSEYRKWVDNDDRPIEQSTRLQRVPLTMGLRWNLIPPGRAVSRLVWVPNRFTPYVTAGAGVMGWRFRQEGDFVDFRSPSLVVFKSTLQDRGWAPMGYAAAGLSWNVNPSLALTTEARYDVASAALRGDFVGFDRIGLSGAGLTAGLQVRY